MVWARLYFLLRPYWLVVINLMIFSQALMRLPQIPPINHIMPSRWRAFGVVYLTPSRHIETITGNARVEWKYHHLRRPPLMARTAALMTIFQFWNAFPLRWSIETMFPTAQHKCHFGRSDRIFECRVATFSPWQTALGIIGSFLLIIIFLFKEDIMGCYKLVTLPASAYWDESDCSVYLNYSNINHLLAKT